MMKIIRINREADEALRRCGAVAATTSRPGFGADGYVLVEVEDAQMADLEQCRFPDESYSDCIIRLAFEYQTQGRKQ